MAKLENDKSTVSKTTKAPTKKVEAKSKPSSSNATSLKNEKIKDSKTESKESNQKIVKPTNGSTSVFSKKSFDNSKIKTLSDKVEMDVKQLFLGIFAALVIASLIIAQLVTKSDDKVAMNEMIVNIALGTALGFVLARGAYGFAGAFRKPIAKKDYALSKSVVIFLAITTTLVAVVASLESANGIISDEYLGVIATNGESTTMSFMFIIGGLLFGMGMIMAGGCASGTLQDVGVGAVGAFLALFGWMFGVFVGFIFKAPMEATWMGESANFNLFTELGIVGGLLVNLIIIGLIYIFLMYMENKFGDKEANQTALQLELENEKNYAAEQVSFISNKPMNRMYFNVFQKKWTLLTTAILLSVIGIFSLTTISGWGISSTYGYWGAWILDGFGADVTSISLTGDASQDIVAGGLELETFNGGFWNHDGSMYNISILIGATMAISLAGKFNLDYKMKLRNIGIFILGGFIMGFGTRLSGGCNIGALVDPIVVGEISGYAYGVLLTIGAWLGLKFMSVTNAL